MLVNQASNDPARRAALRALVHAELARTGLSLRFADPLRGMYEAHSAAPRVAELRLVNYTGITAYVTIVLLINLFVISGPNWLNVALQLTLTPLAALLIMRRFGRPDISASTREAAALATCCCFSLATVLAVAFSPPQTVLVNFFLVTLPVIFVLFFVRLRFGASVLFTAFSAGALAVAVFLHADMPPSLRAYPLGFLLAAAAPALLGVHRLERASRRVYLHHVLQTLQIEDLAQENTALSVLSATDSITGAANRRRLDEALSQLCATAPGGDFLLLIDIDLFKQFNDRHGHLAGDSCLRDVVSVIQMQLAPGELLARFGGEEFAVLLTGTTAPDAHAMAERINQAVQAYPFTVPGAAAAVTVSIGVAERLPGDDAARLIDRADAALYEAKNSGRNCVRGATGEVSGL